MARAGRLEMRIKKAEGKLPQAIVTPSGAAAFAASVIGHEAREHLVALYLDAKNRPVAYDVFTSGGMTFVEVDRLAIFRGALVAGASAIIIVHQHPSGDPTPSDADRKMFAVAQSSADIIGLKMLDALVIADGRYYSITEGSVQPIPMIQNPGMAVQGCAKCGRELTGTIMRSPSGKIYCMRCGSTALRATDFDEVVHTKPDAHIPIQELARMPRSTPGNEAYLACPTCQDVTKQVRVGGKGATGAETYWECSRCGTERHSAARRKA